MPTKFTDIEYTNGQPIEFTVEASDWYYHGGCMEDGLHTAIDFEIEEAKIWDTKREHFTLITNDKFIKKIYRDNFNTVIDTLNG